MKKILVSLLLFSSLVQASERCIITLMVDEYGYETRCFPKNEKHLQKGLGDSLRYLVCRDGEYSFTSDVTRATIFMGHDKYDELSRRNFFERYYSIE